MLVFLYVLQLPNTEVWFQRPKDIVRKLLSGDLDLGIVGLDTLSEYGQVSDDHKNILLKSFDIMFRMLELAVVIFIIIIMLEPVYFYSLIISMPYCCFSV
jgi:hypothetical protein